MMDNDGWWWIMMVTFFSNLFGGSFVLCFPSLCTASLGPRVLRIWQCLCQMGPGSQCAEMVISGDPPRNTALEAMGNIVLSWFSYIIYIYTIIYIYYISIAIFHSYVSLLERRPWHIQKITINGDEWMTIRIGTWFINCWFITFCINSRRLTTGFWWILGVPSRDISKQVPLCVGQNLGPGDHQCISHSLRTFSACLAHSCCWQKWKASSCWQPQPLQWLRHFLLDH